MTPAEETNERNACDEWFHEKGGATIQETWCERGRRAEADLQALRDDIIAIDTWYRGSPSYEHDAGWFKDRVLRVIEERIGFEPCAFCAQPNTCTEAGGCDRGAK